MDMIIQNASGTFDPWQHTEIQSVLFNISKLPKKAQRELVDREGLICFWSHTEEILLAWMFFKQENSGISKKV